MRLLSIFILSVLLVGPAVADRKRDDSSRWSNHHWSDQAQSNWASKHSSDAEDSDSGDEDDDDSSDSNSSNSNHWRAHENVVEWEEYRARLQEQVEQYRSTQQDNVSRRGGRGRWVQSRGEVVNSGVCDELADATPGLRRLCVAFCEIQNCEPDFTLENPLESCSPSSNWILSRYEARRGAGDPDMPCIQQPEVEAACPCWTGAEIAELRGNNEVTDDAMCFLNISNAVFENYDSWQISNKPGAASTYFSSVSAMQGSSTVGPPTCNLTDTCSDGSCLGRNRFLEISPQQHAACETELMTAAVNRSISCEDYGQ